MLFHLDTENCENIRLRFNPNGNLEENILEFCFGMSALYTDFCMQIGLDQDQSRSLLDVVQSCMTRDVEEILSHGLLDSDDDEDDGTDGVSDDEIDELGQAMTDAGFSNEEIQNVINLVKDAGSMDAALKILKGIGENAGIDWSDFED